MNLIQNFALVGMNALDTTRLSTAKKVSLYCMGAGCILELYLNNILEVKGNLFTLGEDLLNDERLTLYQEWILKNMFQDKTKKKLEGDLKWWLTTASHIPFFKLKKFEKTIMDTLKGSDLVEEIPNLLGCDLEFATAGVTMYEYRSNEQAYTRVVEAFRADMLEDIPVTEDNVMLYWMFRESGCMQDLFSREEIKQVDNKISTLSYDDPFSKQLLSITTKHWMDKAMSSFIKKKKEVFSTPIGSGIVYVYPELDRAQAVFIETKEYAADASTRLTEVTNRLVESGHNIEVLRISSVPLIKIDNILYEALPTQKLYRFPVFGVQLRRYRI